MKELLLTINVKCLEPLYVKGKNSAVNMVPFTGSASGKIFEGIVLPYACDTQRFEEGKDANLSARYMLEGTDSTGQKCRIFIDNSCRDESGWHPQIVTDSKAYAYLEDGPLLATVEGTEDGVTVNIYDN